MISFGPFLTRKGQPRWVEPGVFLTEYVLEFASEKCSADVPIFIQNKAECVQFADLFVQATDVMCATGLMYERLNEPALGTYVPFENLLAGLYYEHGAAIPITNFLTEFRSYIPFACDLDGKRHNQKGLLNQEAEQAGFEAISVCQYGRALNIDFAWTLPCADAPVRFHAGSLRYRPTPDGSLGPGKWILPPNTLVSHWLAKALIYKVKTSPVELLSPEGAEFAYRQFKPMKFALLSLQELRTARVKFVRQNPDLHKSPTKMAQQLIAAELYSEHIAIEAIEKQVPRLIAAALHNTRQH